jgi:hypothetical protein
MTNEKGECCSCSDDFTAILTTLRKKSFVSSISNEVFSNLVKQVAIVFDIIFFGILNAFNPL